MVRLCMLDSPPREKKSYIKPYLYYPLSKSLATGLIIPTVTMGPALPSTLQRATQIMILYYYVHTYMYIHIVNDTLLTLLAVVLAIHIVGMCNIFIIGYNS